jgi:hypothetical protein
MMSLKGKKKKIFFIIFCLYFFFFKRFSNIVSPTLDNERRGTLFNNIRQTERKFEIDVDSLLKENDKIDFLYKQGAGVGVSKIGKGWKKRQFVLKGNDVYYIKPETNVKKNFIF